MGDIERSINSILGWGYSPAEWLDLNVRADLAVSQRNNGNAFHFTVSSPFYADAKDKLSLATTASLGDSKCMQTYYGVTALQQENSGFNAFTPKSGIYQVSANLNWTHQFDAKWALHRTLRMTRLQGDAAKSPLTGRRLAPNAVMFVTYAY
jgi:outer membrane protein